MGQRAWDGGTTLSNLKKHPTPMLRASRVSYQGQVVPPVTGKGILLHPRDPTGDPGSVCVHRWTRSFQSSRRAKACRTSVLRGHGGTVVL